MWSPFVSLAKDAPALVAAEVFAVVGSHAVRADSSGFAASGFAGKLASIAFIKLVLRTAPDSLASIPESPALLAYRLLATVVHADTSTYAAAYAASGTPTVS